MNTYYVQRFQAIIVAQDRQMALSYLADELKRKEKFQLDYKDINPNEFIQLDTNFAHAVLLRGNPID